MAADNTLNIILIGHFSGQLHISDSDSEPRASVLMREDSNRSLVTAHVYPRTGRVIFSKASFNRDEPEVELEVPYPLHPLPSGEYFVFANNGLDYWEGWKS